MPQQSEHNGRSIVQDYAKQFEVVFNESLDVIFIVDGESGIILDTNRTMSRTLGYHRDDLIGRDFASLTPPDFASNHTGLIEDVKTSNDVIEPLEFLRADGSRCPMNVAAAVIPWGGYKAIMFTLRDISERRQREKALEDSETRHRLLLASIDSPIVALDTEMNILYCNPRYAHFLGMSSEALEGQSLIDLFPDFVERPSYKTYQQVLQTGKSQIVEGPMQDRFLRSRVYPTPWGILAIADDITESVVHATLIRESEERYRQMFERNQAIKLLIDPDTGGIVDANPSAAAFYGYALNELIQQNIKNINILSDEEVQAEMQAAKTEKRRFFRFTHRLASGKLRDVEVHSGPVDLDGKRYLYSVIHDVTERNQLETELRVSEARYRGIVEDQTELICRFLEDGTITYVNPAMCRYFGVKEVELVGKPFIPSVHTDDIRGVTSKFREMNAENRVISFETRIWRTPDDMRWVSCTARLIIDGNGSPPEYQVVGRDVTEQKRTEESRRELDRQREQARVLSNFIQDASHEFRTPLSVISTNLYILKRNLDPENANERFAMIEDQTADILALVEGLVTMARLDRNITTEDMYVNLNDIVKDSLTQIERELKANKLELVLELAPTLGLVNGNSADLHVAVGNILDNAMRYTPPQGIITVRTGEHVDGISVEIVDNGIGMVEEALPLIFERFYRVDAAHTTRGFGLGLPIAQRIVEGHNGRIEVESEPDVGTIMRIILPAKEDD